MAQRRPVRREHAEDERAVDARDEQDGPDEGDPGEERPRRRRRDRVLTAAKAARLGLEEIPELTGKQPEGVTGVEPTEDGWLVGVEVVEDRRIPSSTDLLATYEIELDSGGELIAYRRVKRYARGRGDSEDS